LIAAGEAVELDEVARAILELLPRAYELTMLGGFTRLLTRPSRVVPRAGLGELLV